VCADLCAKTGTGLDEANKTLGQCSIMAFLAQDIFGGRVYSIPGEGGNFHCYNVIDNCVFDKQIKCDIALVPIGGTYTMDAKKAAELVNIIQPGIAIPIHYGSIVGKKEDADVFAANVNEPVKVEIKMKY